MHRNLLSLAALVAMQAIALQAHAASTCAAGSPNAGVTESTPASAFSFNGDGTVTHGLTGLVWKQCAEGMYGPGCTSGTASAMTWRAALAAATAEATAGYRDWRLPNKKELESIVESCGHGPAINQTVFPAAPALFYWSSSSYVSDPTNAWFVNFNVGYTSNYFKTHSFAVRLVRGGQSFQAFDAAAPRRGVVEYRNTADFPTSPGGHFFYSSDAAEQAAVDAGAAGQFARTGRQFLVGGTHPVCRFYGSMTPGPNSHFFTVDTAECDALKAAQATPTPANIQQWNYEGIAYATTPVIVAANGSRSCPANTQPLYRAYNNAFPPSGARNPWDSNHRYTPVAADIADMVAGGWRDEGIVFCTAQ